MIRIGLLGASRIAESAVLTPARQRADVKVTCVAASSADRAAQYAEQHGIAHVAADYRALVTSEYVDLVYNALPPSGHMHWSIAALRSGKHVLCEKPFAMNAAQAQSMVDAAQASGKILIEAFHYRFHPLFERVLGKLRAGEIGTVRRLEAHFNVPIAYEPGELRFDPALGGGAMMDLGCYPVHWVRTVMNDEPRVLSARARRHHTGVDLAMEAELVFAAGVSAQVSSSMSQDLPEGLDAELLVIGELGSLRVVNPLTPHMGHALIIETRSASTESSPAVSVPSSDECDSRAAHVSGNPQSPGMATPPGSRGQPSNNKVAQQPAAAGRRTEEIAGESTYHHQLTHVVAVLAGEAEQLTGGRDAVGNMRVLDGIYRRAGMRSTRGRG